MTHCKRSAAKGEPLPSSSDRCQYHHLRTLLLALSLLVLSGCQSVPPGLSLKDARFAEGPVIIQRGDHFYLRYRRALEGNLFRLLSVLYVRKTKDAGIISSAFRSVTPNGGI